MEQELEQAERDLTSARLQERKAKDLDEAKRFKEEITRAKNRKRDLNEEKGKLESDDYYKKQKQVEAERSTPLTRRRKDISSSHPDYVEAQGSRFARFLGLD